MADGGEAWQNGYWSNHTGFKEKENQTCRKDLSMSLLNSLHSLWSTECLQLTHDSHL